MNSRPKTSAVILAGGQGRRLGYCDKALQSWRGKPLIEWVIDTLQPQVEQIIISRNRQQSDYPYSQAHSQTQHPHQVCIDQSDGYQGPLAGILAARSLLQHPRILICPCDMPMLPADLVERLDRQLTESKADLVYPYAGERDYFLPVLLQQQAIADLEGHFNRGMRSMREWFATLTANIVAFSDAEGFSNFNNPADFLADKGS